MEHLWWLLLWIDSILKHVQHFDVHSSTWQKEMETKKKNIQFVIFRNMCNIAICLEKLTRAP